MAAIPKEIWVDIVDIFRQSTTGEDMRAKLLSDRHEALIVDPDPEETTVLCITGNGLKTTDALAGRFAATEPIPPKLAAFEEYLERELAAPGAAKGVA